MIDRQLVIRAGVGREGPPLGDRGIPVGALRRVRLALDVREGGLVRGDETGPRATLDGHVADGHPLFHRQAADGLAAVLEDVARAAAHADARDEVEDDVLGRDARLEAAVDVAPRTTRGGRWSSVWVASTISTSEVPMPNASAPNAPWVAVCESPHTMVMPGCVRPSSGPMTCTIPWWSEPRVYTGTPNSVQLRSSWATWKAACWSRMGRPRRRRGRLMVRRGDGPLRMADRDAAVPEALRTPAGW